LSSYAYAKGVLVVGGYRRSDGEPAVYSSSGRHGLVRKDADGNSVEVPDVAGVSEESPALTGSPSGRVAARPTKDAGGNPLYGPDMAAVSEESPVLPGVLAAGTYSGSVAILSGTSVAAPQVTRALADQIANPAIAQSTAQMPETAVTGLKNAVLKAERKQKAAVAALGRGQPDRRELRYGVGRLSFKSPYPNNSSSLKRIGE
jgi:hypothetical protein